MYNLKVMHNNSDPEDTLCVKAVHGLQAGLLVKKIADYRGI